LVLPDETTYPHINKDILLSMESNKNLQEQYFEK